MRCDRIGDVWCDLADGLSFCGVFSAICSFGSGSGVVDEAAGRCSKRVTTEAIVASFGGIAGSD